MEYLFFDGKQNVQVGKNSIMVGGFTEEPLALMVYGITKGHVVSDLAPISDDGVRWVQRLTLEFDRIETIYVQPNEDRSQITTITVEPV